MKGDKVRALVEFDGRVVWCNVDALSSAADIDKAIASLTAIRARIVQITETATLEAEANEHAVEAMALAEGDGAE